MDEESLTVFSLDGGTEATMLKTLSQIIRVINVAELQRVMRTVWGNCIRLFAGDR